MNGRSRTVSHRAIGWLSLAGALLLTAWAVWSEPVPAALPLAVVAVLCLALEAAHLTLPYASVVTFGAAATLPAIVVVGPGYAAVCGGLAQLLLNLRHRRPSPTVIFNPGQRAICIVLAGVAWNLVQAGRLSAGMPQPALHPDRVLLAAAACVAVYVLATHALVSVYSASRRGLPLWTVLTGNAAIRFAATPALGCLGMLFIFVVWQIPTAPPNLQYLLGLPVVAGFAFLAYDSHRRSSRQLGRLYAAVTDLVQAADVTQLLERLAALLSREATPTALWIALRDGAGRFEVAISRGADGAAMQPLADVVTRELWGPQPAAGVRLLRIADHARNRPQPLAVSGDPVRSVMLAPLVAGHNLVGAVGMVHPVADYFIPAQEQAVVALTAQAAFVANYLRIHSESQQNLARAEALQIRNIDLLRESERRAHQLSLLNRAFLRVAASLATEEVFAALADELHSTLGYPRVALRLIDGGMMRLVANHGVPPEVGTREAVPVSHGIIGRVARTGQPALVLDVRRDPDYRPTHPGAHSLVTQQASAPILSRGTVVGVITVQSIEPVLGPTDLELLTTFAGYAALAIGNAQHYEEARTLATTDGLTGLPNRRSLWEAFDRELARAIRYGTPLAVVMVEVDRFKHYNDTHGHLRGDDALRKVSRVLMQEHRAHIDLVARYGGDEFVVLLPQTGKVEAAAIEERIRRTMGGPDGTPAVTISCGVAGFPDDGRTIEVLLRAADRSMYEAKATGGDAVAVAPGSAR